MRNRMIVLCGFTGVAATVSIALAQTGVCFKYGSLGTAITAGEPACQTYTSCPNGWRCLTGRSDKKVSNPWSATVACTTFIGGTGTYPNCTGGTALLGTPATVTVPDQKCSGGCLSGPPA